MKTDHIQANAFQSSAAEARAPRASGSPARWTSVASAGHSSA
ncbi:hypothetical protein [Rubrobacter tropicus]|nr:hypothetical protein [Rubrobacter tropicus]